MRFASIVCITFLPLFAQANDISGRQFAEQARAYATDSPGLMTGAFVEYVTGVSTMAAATRFACPGRASYPEILRRVASFVLTHPGLWPAQDSFDLTNAALVQAYPCRT